MTTTTTALVVSASSLIALGFTLRTWAKSREQQRQQEKQEQQLWLESHKTALFFPCHFPENPNSSIQKFMSYLSNAKRKLQICVMTITFGQILNILKEKHKDGVLVQICTSQHTDRKIGAEFKRFGIEVKSQASAYSTQMHHKFVIIDDLIVMTGSLNWSREAITHQAENVLITTDPNIVLKFSKEFQKIWKSFDDPVDQRQIVHPRLPSGNRPKQRWGK